MGENQQDAAALPGQVKEVRKKLGVVGQLGQNLRDAHPDVSVHGGFKVAGQGHLDRHQEDG